MADTPSIKKTGAFSLLEIIVVFMLIATISAVTSISYSKIIQHGRFQDSVNVIREKITLAKKLARLTQGSVSLIFSQDEPDGKISYSMTGESLPNKRIKEALEKKEALPGIAHLSFESQENIQYAWPICLVFYPNGACYSHTIFIKNELFLKIAPRFKGNSVSVEVYKPILPSQTDEGSSFYPHELENKL